MSITHVTKDRKYSFWFYFMEALHQYYWLYLLCLCFATFAVTILLNAHMNNKPKHVNIPVSIYGELVWPDSKFFLQDTFYNTIAAFEKEIARELPKRVRSVSFTPDYRQQICSTFSYNCTNQQGMNTCLAGSIIYCK